MKHVPDARNMRRLPTVLTTPLRRQRPMPVQEITVWTPRLAIVALSRVIAEFFSRPAREAIRDEA